MNRSRAAVLLAMVALVACSRATVGSHQSTMSPVEKARADSAKWPYTKADIDFMSGMIHHHAQAIVMAKLAPTNGAGSSVSILCQRIINAQNDEIHVMQQWLRERNQPVPEPNPKGMKMVMDGVEHVMPMPGMLSDEQMAELTAARGKEFDQLFLKYMIQHHQGAVSMVKTLISSRGAALDETVFKVASDINVDQETEIARMQKMLFNLLTEKSSQ
ncbi:MAG TPA: DUF305 domain-containing protein [Gemmatimonadaceae bacterium]|nr:DUF305 domain-containing protein [Gemmatimonadaceae bacterium]